MNFAERIVLITGETDEVEVTAYGMAVLVSAKEAEGNWSITDVSFRVPPSYDVSPVTGKIRLETGPLAGTYSIKQVRPSRHHTRYIASRLS